MILVVWIQDVVEFDIINFEIRIPKSETEEALPYPVFKLKYLAQKQPGAFLGRVLKKCSGYRPQPGPCWYWFLNPERQHRQWKYAPSPLFPNGSDIWGRCFCLSRKDRKPPPLGRLQFWWKHLPGPWIHGVPTQPPCDLIEFSVSEFGR